MRPLPHAHAWLEHEMPKKQAYQKDDCFAMHATASFGACSLNRRYPLPYSHRANRRPFTVPYNQRESQQPPELITQTSARNGPHWLSYVTADPMGSFLLRVYGPASAELYL